MLEILSLSLVVAVFAANLGLSVRAWQDYRDTRALRSLISAGALFLGALSLPVARVAIASADRGIEVLEAITGAMTGVLLIVGMALVMTHRGERH